MALSDAQAVERGRELLKTQQEDRSVLDELRRYWKGRQRLPGVIPQNAPREIREMARRSRVNVIDIVVESLAQSLFTDGFRSADPPEEGQLDPLAPLWRVWQANRWDRWQSGTYRAAVAYGTAYELYLPGEPQPVMSARSPRHLTAMYGADPDWPRFAFERETWNGTYRLYDETHWYRLTGSGNDSLRVEAKGEHGARIFVGPTQTRPVCPVVRFQDAVDLDLDDDAEQHLANTLVGGDEFDHVAGQVAPLVPLQDQINLTSFSLKAAEWYSAFRQRWIVGWTPASEEEKMRTGSSQTWTFDENPENVQLGEFGQTVLDGYIRSRESSAKFTSTLSQTPVHELTGELIQMSAEALAAAEAGKDRKVGERKTGFGESREQGFQVIGGYLRTPVPVDAQVVWRDTSSHAFSATVDALGKLVSLLGVPPQELWDRVPGTTAQDVRRWRAVAAEMNGLGVDLAALLGGNGGEPRSGLILPPGVG